MDHSSSTSQNDIISPIPQRAYAFVGLFDGEDPAPRPHSVPWGGAPGLVRPVSAPVGILSAEVASSGVGVMERPTSPLCRVANPMVRDNLFRRGFAGGEKMRKSRLNACGKNDAE